MAKQVTVIVVRADHKLWDGGPLKLAVTDLRTLKPLPKSPFAVSGSIIEVNLNLPFDAGQLYGIHVDADDHRSAWQIIKPSTFVREENGHRIEIDNAIFKLMLVPDRPRSLDLDEGYQKLVDEGSPFVVGAKPWPREQFVDMKDAPKMAFLNIDAKVRDTRINGLPIRSFVRGVGHVAAARVFLFVKPELKDLVAAAPDFAPAPGHKKPPTGTTLPGHPDSWKHKKFGAGNLQLSFSKTTMELPDNPGTHVYSVDADIDLERDLLHVAEWLDNEVFHPNQKTDQTLVYALLFSQGIIPRYTLSARSDAP
jgi:hypothetical protein